MAATLTGAKAFTADPERFRDTVASVAIKNAAIGLHEGVQTIERLALDKTRLAPQKHDAARKVANDVIDRLSAAKATVEERARQLYKAGLDEAERAFAPNYQRTAIESEIRTWIRDQVKQPEGIGKVGELLRTNREAAAVVYQSPTFLLGIAEQAHTKFKFEAVERFLPASYAKMVESIQLQDVPAKLDKAIAAVKTSFYMPGVAADMATRVEV